MRDVLKGTLVGLGLAIEVAKRHGRDQKRLMKELTEAALKIIAVSADEARSEIRSFLKEDC